MRNKLLRKKDWERIDRVLDYKYFTGAIMGAGVSQISTAIPLNKFLNGIILTFVVAPGLALFWDRIEELTETVTEEAKDQVENG